jgi:hypothetical protein
MTSQCQQSSGSLGYILMHNSREGSGMLQANVSQGEERNTASGTQPDCHPTCYLAHASISCIHRKNPVNRGDNVYQPESFPPSAEKDVPEAPMQIPDLSDEDREEVSLQCIYPESCMSYGSIAAFPSSVRFYDCRASIQLNCYSQLAEVCPVLPGT